MIRLQLNLELKYDVLEPGSDLILNIHAAETDCQQVLSEQMTLSQNIPSELFRVEETANRYVRIHAIPGPLHVRYQATVDLRHRMAAPETIAETPVAQLPASVLRYLYPSRYCQSDRLTKLAIREFGQMWRGYQRVLAIQNWVQQHVSFVTNTSDANTSAVDTIIEQVGVCRDFAHLMIALCRALSIPARFVTGTDFGADPLLGPPDFHAYVEVFLDGRWYLFDPSGTATPMGLLRIGTGRDAADVAFAMIFGSVISWAPLISTQAMTTGHPDLIQPYRCVEALSTIG